MRRARFKLSCPLDGARGGTVTIEGGDEHAVVSVRPSRRRRTYTLPLAVVAEIVLCRVAKAEDATRRREKKARRG